MSAERSAAPSTAAENFISALHAENARRNGAQAESDSSAEKAPTGSRLARRLGKLATGLNRAADWIAEKPIRARLSETADRVVTPVAEGIVDVAETVTADAANALQMTAERLPAATRRAQEIGHAALLDVGVSVLNSVDTARARWHGRGNRARAQAKMGLLQNQYVSILEHNAKNATTLSEAQAKIAHNKEFAKAGKNKITRGVRRVASAVANIEHHSTARKSKAELAAIERTRTQLTKETQKIAAKLDRHNTADAFRESAATRTPNSLTAVPTYIERTDSAPEPLAPRAPEFRMSEPTGEMPMLDDAAAQRLFEAQSKPPVRHLEVALSPKQQATKEIDDAYARLSSRPAAPVAAPRTTGKAATAELMDWMNSNRAA